MQTHIIVGKEPIRILKPFYFAIKSVHSFKVLTIIRMKIIEKNERFLDGRRYFSQAAQDLFVLFTLNHKKGGHYLEIGSGHPFESNNTALLELDYGWSGLSIERNDSLQKEFSKYRDNICICNDSTLIDYESILNDFKIAKRIDYLSLDVDPANITYDTLLKLPLENFRFSIITYEHDRYIAGDKYMELSRKYLKNLNYFPIAKNVCFNGKDFEDWYVDIEYFKEKFIYENQSENTSFEQVIYGFHQSSENEKIKAM